MTTINLIGIWIITAVALPLVCGSFLAVMTKNKSAGNGLAFFLFLIATGIILIIS